MDCTVDILPAKERGFPVALMRHFPGVHAPPALAATWHQVPARAVRAASPAGPVLDLARGVLICVLGMAARGAGEGEVPGYTEFFGRYLIDKIPTRVSPDI